MLILQPLCVNVWDGGGGVLYANYLKHTKRRWCSFIFTGCGSCSCSRCKSQGLASHKHNTSTGVYRYALPSTQRILARLKEGGKGEKGEEWESIRQEGRQGSCYFW